MRTRRLTRLCSGEVPVAVGTALRHHDSAMGLTLRPLMKSASPRSRTVANNSASSSPRLRRQNEPHRRSAGNATPEVGFSLSTAHVRRIAKITPPGRARPCGFMRTSGRHFTMCTRGIEPALERRASYQIYHLCTRPRLRTSPAAPRDSRERDQCRWPQGTHD